MSKKEIVLVSSALLRAHERARKKHVDHMEEEIRRDGYVTHPLLVDKNTMIVLDGHHRLAALRRMGMSRIPVSFVDYKSPSIKVSSWRKGERITKKKVRDAGLSGKLLPIKTSRHIYSRKAIETIVKLEDLK
jgi:hypothetical protein